MTISTISRKLGFAFIAIALVASAFIPAIAMADEDGGYDYYGGGYDYDSYDYYGGDYDYDTTDYYGGEYDYDTTDYFGGDYEYDEEYDYEEEYDYDEDYDYEDEDYGSESGSGSGCGSSCGGSGFKMPSFGGMSFANQSYRESYNYPMFTYPSIPASKTTVNVETCKNNSCNYTDNSITDNSIKINNSFNGQQEYAYEDCYSAGYGYEGYGQSYAYGYEQGYGYQGGYYDECYPQPLPPMPQTPYITLSSAPYTGLDLGPMGEVLYWTFLVLWCLGAAYLIVVKRVQNNLVSFLSGFLFGGNAGSNVHAHTTHAPAKTHAAASAPVVEEGTDPFIAAQIAKRSR
jgi:hypothetical protein